MMTTLNMRVALAGGAVAVAVGTLSYFLGSSDPARDLPSRQVAAVSSDRPASQDAATLPQKYDQLLLEQQYMKEDIDRLSENVRQLLAVLQATQSQPGADDNLRSNALTNTGVQASTPNIQNTNVVSPESEADYEARMEREFDRERSRVFVEESDPRWSITASRNVIETVRSAQFEGTSVLTTECRATRCYLQVAHESEKAMEQFQSYFPQVLAWENSSGQMQSSRDSGQLVTSLVISRPGY